MKKILIWDSVALKNIGGPSGYLYNIHEYLKDNPSDQITFLSDVIKHLEDNSNKDRKSVSILTKICDIIPHSLKQTKPLSFFKLIIERILFIYNFIVFNFKKNLITIPENFNLNDFDFIHFHLTPDVLKFKKKYPDFRGKIILTSHCPCPWTYEVLDTEKKLPKCLYPLFLHQEIMSYKHSSYLMFPCREAREPYEKNKSIKKCYKSIESKFFYVPTGIIDKSQPPIKNDLRTSLGIGVRSFVIGFFGRHSAIKGFDVLKEIGLKLFDTNKDVFFVCAGSGEIDPLIHPHWIELGFIDNVQEYMSICDLYIVPNRDTFFDLAVLELLRAGVPLLLSSNGGNLYFKRLPTNETKGIGFININNTDEVVHSILKLYLEKEQTPEKFNQRKEYNQRLFKNYFTTEVFLNHYLKEIEALP